MGYRSFVAVALTALLAACGGESDTLGSAPGGGGTPAPTSVTLSGVTAVGAPVTGATISAKCRSGTTPASVTSNSSGVYTGLVVPSSAFPCVIRSSGGTANSVAAPTLHSFASTSSNTTANITPLTDLVTALALKNGASQSDINAWFASSQGSSTLNQLAGALSTAQTSLLGALTSNGNYGVTLPAGFNPFSSSITPPIPPATNADPYDNLLEAIQTALEAASSSHAALLASFISSPASALPDPVEPGDPSGLTFNVSNITANSITIVVNGTLSATEPTLSRNMLYLHAPGNWITYAKPASSDTVSVFDPAGSPISGKTVAVAVATDSEHQSAGNKSFGDHVAINFGGSNLQASTDTGTGQAFTITFPENVFVPSALQSLSLSWGATHTTFGTLQGTATVSTGGTEPEEPVDPGIELLDGKNGIAFVYGNHTWKLGRNVQVARFSVPSGSNFRNLNASNINAAGTGYTDTTSFEGGTVYTAELNLDPTVTSGTTTCNGNTWLKVVVPATGLFTEAERTWTATSCSLQIDYMSTRGGIGGRILSATLYNETKNKSITLAGGQFRVYQHTGTTGTAPTPLSGDTWTSFNITGGTSFELPSGQYFLLNRQNVSGIGSSFSAGGRVHDGTLIFDGNAEDNIVWAVTASAFGNTPNSNYTCGTVYTAGTKMQMFVRMGTYLNQHEFNSALTGGSCTITVEKKVGNLVKGSYIATLVDKDNSNNKIVISGDFRTFTNDPIKTSNNGDEGTLGSSAGVDILIVDGNSLFTTGQRFRQPVSENYNDQGASGLLIRYDLLNEVPGNYNATQELRRLDKGFDLRFQFLPKAVGSYACGTAYNVGSGNADANGKYTQMYLYTEQNISFTAVRYQNPIYVLKNGASCTINVTKLDSTVIEGNYTATMTDEDAASMLTDGDGSITISGSFRHIFPAP